MVLRTRQLVCLAVLSDTLARLTVTITCFRRCGLLGSAAVRQRCSPQVIRSHINLPSVPRRAAGLKTPPPPRGRPAAGATAVSTPASRPSRQPRPSPYPPHSAPNRRPTAPGGTSRARRYNTHTSLHTPPRAPPSTRIAVLSGVMRAPLISRQRRGSGGRWTPDSWLCRPSVTDVAKRRATGSWPLGLP